MSDSGAAEDDDSGSKPDLSDNNNQPAFTTNESEEGNRCCSFLAFMLKIISNTLFCNATVSPLQTH